MLNRQKLTFVLFGTFVEECWSGVEGDLENFLLCAFLREINEISKTAIWSIGHLKTTMKFGEGFARIGNGPRNFG